MNTYAKIPVGISSCLLGEHVRFNGGHKRDNYINQRLVDFFDFQPVCPEVGIGMGVPRDPIRLVKVNNELRVQDVKDSTVDVTDQLHAYGIKTTKQLEHICGYIFKSRSPSCGMERVKTYTSKGLPSKSDGVGAFAEEIMRAMPNLPVEEEGRLNDPVLRDNFIERVFTFYRWQLLKNTGITPARLVAFHTQHKLVVMAHNQTAYRRLGQLVAAAGRKGFNKLTEKYEAELMSAMKRPATRRQHTNVLQHLQGYFSRSLSAGDRQEMTEIISQYLRGLVPLVAPLTLIRHHLRHHPNDWALQQVYLDPYPRELM